MLGAIMPGKLVGPRISSLEESGTPRPSEENSAGVVANADALEGALKVQLAGKLRADPGIRLGDKSFYLPTVLEVKGILAASAGDRRVWLEERFDCDDFAYVLKGEISVHAYATNSLRFGLCFGIVWGNFDWVDGYHAVNWFISNDGELRFVEPQDDVIHNASECSGDVWLLLA